MLKLSLLLTLGAWPAAAAPAEADQAPAQEARTQPPAVAGLAREYIEEYREERKELLLRELGRTPPRDIEDARALLNLYNRGTEAERQMAESSLVLLSTSARHLAPFFLDLLRKDQDFVFQSFGLAGALQLRADEALPRVREIASLDFRHRDPTTDLSLADSARWYLQLQALRALALWEGEACLPLLYKKSQQAPRVAELAAVHFWEQALPEIVRWSESRKDEDKARAKAAWTAPIPMGKLRATLPRLLELALDRSKRLETRHQAAILAGLASDDPAVELLLREREAAKDKKTRLILSAALFASRHPRVIPLLVEHVKENPSAPARAGALLQLKQMLPPQEYQGLLRWVAESDPDKENQSLALRELSTVAVP